MGVEKQILVFAKDPEALKEAEIAGAARCGGLDLVEDIAKGRVEVVDIDHFLAHEDIEKELKPLIGILREKMPKKQLGTVSKDLSKLVKTFANGMEVSVIKPKTTLGYADDPTYGFAELQVGRLNMENVAISGNLMTAISTLREKMPKREGGWVTRCQLYVE